MFSARGGKQPCFRLLGEPLACFTHLKHFPLYMANYVPMERECHFVLQACQIDT